MSDQDPRVISHPHQWDERTRDLVKAAVYAHHGDLGRLYHSYKDTPAAELIYHDLSLLVKASIDLFGMIDDEGEGVQ